MKTILFFIAAFTCTVVIAQPKLIYQEDIGADMAWKAHWIGDTKDASYYYERQKGLYVKVPMDGTAPVCLKVLFYFLYY